MYLLNTGAAAGGGGGAVAGGPIGAAVGAVVGVTVGAFGGLLIGDDFHAVKKHQHDQGKDK